MKLSDRIRELEARVGELERHPALSVPALNVTRANAARVAGKRSAEVRKQKHGSAQPKPRTAPPARSVVAEETDPAPSMPPSAQEKPAIAPPATTPLAPMPSVAVVVDEETARAARGVLGDSVIGWRSSAPLIDAVPRVMHAWCAPFGLTFHRIADLPSTDADLRAILEALAAGYSVDRLEAAGTRAPADRAILLEESPGPSSFTAELLRRLIGEARV